MWRHQRQSVELAGGAELDVEEHIVEVMVRQLRERGVAVGDAARAQAQLTELQLEELERDLAVVDQQGVATDGSGLAGVRSRSRPKSDRESARPNPTTANRARALLGVAAAGRGGGTQRDACRCDRRRSGMPVRVVATSARRALQLEHRGIEFTQQRQRVDGSGANAPVRLRATLVPTKMQWASRPESSARLHRRFGVTVDHQEARLLDGGDQSVGRRATGGQAKLQRQCAPLEIAEAEQAHTV